MSWLDLSGVKEDRGRFEMIPVGSYHVCCKVAELKETKDGSGKAKYFDRILHAIL